MDYSTRMYLYKFRGKTIISKPRKNRFELLTPSTIWGYFSFMDISFLQVCGMVLTERIVPSTCLFMIRNELFIRKMRSWLKPNLELDPGLKLDLELDLVLDLELIKIDQELDLSVDLELDHELDPGLDLEVDPERDLDFCIS